jgi:hypothetical protein
MEFVDFLRKVVVEDVYLTPPVMSKPSIYDRVLIEEHLVPIVDLTVDNLLDYARTHKLRLDAFISVGLVQDASKNFKDNTPLKEMIRSTRALLINDSDKLSEINESFLMSALIQKIFDAAFGFYF